METTTIIIKPKLSETLPVTVSADGKRNAYAFRCARGHVGGYVSYAACLHKIELAKQKKLPGYSDCADPIRHKTCPALAMSAEEADEGKAIYFAERVRHGMIGALIDKAKELIMGGTTLDTSGDGRVSVDPKDIVASPKVKKQAEAARKIEADYMAQAINAAMEEHAETKPDPVPEKPKAAAPKMAQVKPGESMLEAARRLLAERKSNGA